MNDCPTTEPGLSADFPPFLCVVTIAVAALQQVADLSCTISSGYRACAKNKQNVFYRVGKKHYNGRPPAVIPL
jgi:hypothetical protein